MSYSEALKRILDAITPELKPANQAMQKVIKLNLVSSAIYHTELEKLDKAIKANDVEKAAEQAGRLVSLSNQAGKQIESDIAEAKEKLAKAMTEIANSKVSVKNAEAKEKSIATALKASETVKTPTQAKKVERLCGGLREFGDFLARANKISELIQKKKDPDKQVDLLKSALAKAAIKAKKETDKIKADLAKSQNALVIAKDLVKLRDKKFSAYQSERIALGDLVKVLRKIAPDAKGVKRILHGTEDTPEQKAFEEAQRALNEIRSIRDKYEKELAAFGEYKVKRDEALKNYERECKRLVWAAKESIDKASLGKDMKTASGLLDASEIMRKAYKLNSWYDRKSLYNESNRAANLLIKHNVPYEEIFSPIAKLIKSLDGIESYKLPFGITGGIGENIGWHVNNGAPGTALKILIEASPDASKYEAAIKRYKDKRKEAGELNKTLPFSFK